MPQDPQKRDSLILNLQVDPQCSPEGIEEITGRLQSALKQLVTATFGNPANEDKIVFSCAADHGEDASVCLSLTQTGRDSIKSATCNNELRILMIEFNAELNKGLKKVRETKTKNVKQDMKTDAPKTPHTASNVTTDDDGFVDLSIKIQADAVDDMTGLNGMDAVHEARCILHEELDRKFDQVLGKKNLPSTPGERYLQRRTNKGGFYYPEGVAGDLLRAFEAALGSYFGHTGHIAKRLYDLLKTAGIVPDAGEKWEHSRAKAIRTEFYNAVCYGTHHRIMNEIRDKLLTEIHHDEPCTQEESESGHRIGRDFKDRSELEKWILDGWHDWMTDAADEAKRLAHFISEPHQHAIWDQRLNRLFCQDGRGCSEFFSTEDALVQLMQLCLKEVTEEILSQIPVRV